MYRCKIYKSKGHRSDNTSVVAINLNVKCGVHRAHPKLCTIFSRVTTIISERKSIFDKKFSLRSYNSKFTTINIQKYVGSIIILIIIIVNSLYDTLLDMGLLLVACLSLFYEIYHIECTMELHYLIPPFAFRRLGFHIYVVDIPGIHMKHFISEFMW